jgi:hypothetical protein
MKRHLKRPVLLLSIFALATFAAAQDRRLLTANVGFDFTVNNTRLPAGNYTVYLLAPYHLLKLQSADARNVALVSSTPGRSNGSANSASKLVFLDIRGRYVLREIVDESDRRELPLPSFLLEEAKNGTALLTITVLASAARE